MESKDNTSIDAPLDLSKEEMKKGHALKKWSVFFFVLSCIATFLMVTTLALPFFLTVFGIISAIVWFIALIFFTVFTLGLIWLNDTTKKINGSWMSFNNMLFNSGDATSEFVIRTFPIIAIIGVSIIAITWVFMIFGFITDKKRHKFYKAMFIVLGIITFVYIVIAVISTVVISKQAPAQATN